MGMMKKMFVLGCCAAAFSLTANAQKTTEYRSSQARLIEPRMGVYTKPLIADLEIDKAKGKVKDIWEFTADEVVAMGGEEENVRKSALYKSMMKHDADVIVAAIFDVVSTNAGCKVTLIGYPAKYVNWRTATDADNAWIHNEVLKPENDSKATKAISE